MQHHYKFLTRLFDFKNPEIQLISVWSAISSAIITFSNSYLGISAGLFCMLFIIMITDYITGLKASKFEEKQKAKKENRAVTDVFSSKKGLGWVFKFGAYMTFLYISLNMIDYIKSNEMEFMVLIAKLAHFYILIHIFYWEIKSVDENFDRLGYDFKILKLMSNLFKVFSKLTESKLKQASEDDK